MPRIRSGKYTTSKRSAIPCPTVGKEEKEWGKDEVITLPDADDTLKKIQGNINDSKEKIEERMNHLKERIALMNRLEADVDKLSKEEDVQPDEKKAFDDEKKELIYLLGSLLEKTGKKEEAIEQFKQIYEQDIGYKDVAAKVDAYYSGQG